MDRLTIPEYELLMEAERLKQVDKDYRNHLQAFLNFIVRAERKAGKNKTRPVYNRFDRFYDYDAQLKQATNSRRNKEKSRFSGVGKFLKKGE